jgi:hypothetical protein
MFNLILVTLQICRLCLANQNDDQTVLDAACADLKGFDVSRAQAGLNSNFWTCAFNAGYEKVVIRACQHACGSGGRVGKQPLPRTEFLLTLDVKIQISFLLGMLRPMLDLPILMLTCSHV